VSYEAGVKATLAGGRAQTRLNVYAYTFENLQVLAPGPGGSFVVDNVGEVDGSGVEWEVQAFLGRHLQWRLSAAWADTEGRGIAALCGDTSGCEGNRLGRMPAFSYGTVLRATMPAQRGDWFARVEAFGQSEVYGGPSLDPDFSLDGWLHATLRAGYASNAGWEITAYVENVGDERFFDGVNEHDAIIPGTVFGPNRPRTAGVRLHWSTRD
jgi:iron complex outermembrane receptor protein